MKLLFYIFAVVMAVMLIKVLLDTPQRLKNYNAGQCAVYGKQADCKTPLTPQQLCENYYNHVCTIDGELPEGVVIIK